MRGRSKLSAAVATTVAGALFVVAVVALVVVVDRRDGLDDADRVASVVGAAAGVASLVLAAVALLLSRRHTGTDTRRPLRDLARAVRDQWTQEAAVRHLLEPDPISTEWSLTTRPVSAPLTTVLRRPGHTPDASDGDRQEQPPPLHGHPADLAGLFHRLPRHQLVVLGEPGAGKSALTMLLAVELAEAWLADEGAATPSVPVIVPLGSWDPTRERLETYVAATLVRDYPFLAEPSDRGGTLAQALLADRDVLPVLDGLDEIPVALRTAAINGIKRDFARDRPVVLTCRGEEYQRAVEETGLVLPSALVVEIARLRAPAIVEFLSAGSSSQTMRRWEPVLRDLRERPDGPVAMALSTPLFVTVAQTVFTPPRTRPETLLDLPDRAAVEDHLLDRFLPAAYEARPPLRIPGVPERLTGGQSTRNVERWLTFLATQMSARRTRDLVWWDLPLAVPAAGVGAVVGLLAAVPLAALALLVAPAVYVLSGAAVVGLVVGVVAAVSASNGAPVAVSWTLDRSRLRGFRPDLALATVLAVGLFAAFGHLWAGIVAAVVAVLFLVVPASLVGVSDTRRAVLPRVVLRRDGWAAAGMILAVTVVGGGGLALVLHIVGAPTPAVAAGPLVGLATGLTYAGGTTYGVFLVARLWLAARGQLPWRVHRFLEDAHRREVLRRVGVLWQFRHARLQDRLAGATIAAGSEQPAVLTSAPEPPEDPPDPPLRERLRWGMGAFLVGALSIPLLWNGREPREAVLTGITIALASGVLGYHSYDPRPPSARPPDGDGPDPR